MHHYRLQALALLAQAGGIALVYALIVFAARRVPTGGMDWDHWILTVIGAGIPAVLMIWAHVAIAKQLLRAKA